MAARSRINSRISDKQRVGVVTADPRYIITQLLDGVGVDLGWVRLAGIKECLKFARVVFQDKHELNVRRMEKKVVWVAIKVVSQDPKGQGILLECGSLPSFDKAVQKTTDLRIFHFNI